MLSARTNHLLPLLLSLPPLLTVGYGLAKGVSFTHLLYNLLAYALAREYDSMLLLLTGVTVLSVPLLVQYVCGFLKKSRNQPRPEILFPSDGARIAAENQARIALLTELLRNAPPKEEKPRKKPVLEEGLDMGNAG